MAEVISVWSINWVLRKKLNNLTVLKLHCQRFPFLEPSLSWLQLHRLSRGWWIYFSSNCNMVASVIRNYSCDARFSEGCKILSIASACVTSRMAHNEKIRGKQILWISGVLLRCLKIYNNQWFIHWWEDRKHPPCREWKSDLSCVIFCVCILMH